MVSDRRGAILAAVLAFVAGLALGAVAVQTLRGGSSEPNRGSAGLAEQAPRDQEATRPARPDPMGPPPETRNRTSGSGLHYTPEEVEIWRERAREGPYRSPGDAAENSPGDWERIRENAEAFVDDPEAGRWPGPDDEGCVRPYTGEHPPTLEASQLRDAAFYSLVERDSEYREAVKDELLAQAGEPGVDFSDDDRWCPGVLLDIAPATPTAHWLTKLLFAYDYLGEDAFNEDERALLDEWFADAARFFQQDAEGPLEDNFVDRMDGDYRLSEERTTEPGCDERTAYYGSRPICAIARYYNNRRAALVRFVALVGIQQGEPSFQRTGEKFVKEWLAFSVYPEGYYGEFERWTESLPDLGWAYATNTAGAVITIADAFARAGDTSLYDHMTSMGAQGTSGRNKTLLSATTMLGAYLDGTYERYATDDADQVGDEDHRIDGKHEPDDWFSAHDVLVTPANVYYRNDYLYGLYSRTGEGMPPYPDEPATNGEHDVWSGEAGVYPGVLFMFGQMEGEVWPFP